MPASTLCMMTHRLRGVIRDCDKKADGDLNYVGHKMIHINIPFIRSQKSKDVKVVETEV